MTKHGKGARPQPRNQAGGLAPVEVIKQGVAEGGFTRVNISVDGLEPPSARFAADQFQLKHVDGEMRILFGQRRLAGDGLRAMVEVRVPAGTVEHMLGSLTEFPIEGEKAPPKEITDEPDESVALYANVLRVALGMHGACTDFFLISPFAFGDGKLPDEVAVDPVVRVMMPDAVLRGLLSEWRKKP